jgi:hypothetical protein
VRLHFGRHASAARYTDGEYVLAFGDGELVRLGPFTVTVPLTGVARTATYTRTYATEPGFMTLVSDGERLTGAYAVGPEAGEWLRQAPLAIRGRVPMAVLRDVIQPFATFSEAFLHALLALRAEVPAAV